MKKIFLSLAVVAAAMFSFSACNNADKVSYPSKGNVKLVTDLDSVAYCFGLLNGQGFSQVKEEGAVFPDVALDADLILAAFNASFNNDSNNYTIDPKEAEEILNNFQMKVQEKMRAEQMKQQEEMQKKVEENKVKGADFLAANSKKEGVTTLESGLQIQHLTNGRGKTPKETDMVKVNYKGMLIDGTVFDQNDSIDFPLMNVVPGFREGIMNMKEGGKAILTMPYNLAYGERGAGQMIEGGSTLQFEVELLEILK